MAPDKLHASTHMLKRVSPIDLIDRRCMPQFFLICQPTAMLLYQIVNPFLSGKHQIGRTAYVSRAHVGRIDAAYGTTTC